jgi:hypothetical protein
MPESMRNDHHGHPTLFARCHRIRNRIESQADAVHGKRSLGNAVTDQRGRDRKLQHPALTVFLHAPETSHAVDMPLHDVAGKPLARSHRPLEIECRACGEPPQGRALQGLSADIERGLACPGKLRDRETNTFDRDTLARGKVLKSRLNPEPAQTGVLPHCDEPA